MDCAESLELLSDFHDGALDQAYQAKLGTHLDTCPGCADVFRDLDTIVLAATALRTDSDVAFPDENAIWQRMSIGKPTIH